MVEYHRMNPIEEWKKIPGFDAYEASSFGNVRHHINKANLKPYMLHGYKMLRIINTERVVKSVRVHHLIAYAFLGPRPSPLHEIDHIDGGKYDKLNNRPENLQWVTKKENMKRFHAQRTGRLPPQPMMLENNTEVLFLASIAAARKHFGKAIGTICSAIALSKEKPNYKWNGWRITPITIEQYKEATVE